MGKIQINIIRRYAQKAPGFSFTTILTFLTFTTSHNHSPNQLNQPLTKPQAFAKALSKCT